MMASFTLRGTLVLGLLVVMGSTPAQLSGQVQVINPPCERLMTGSSDKTEDWPGQIRAYIDFADSLARDEDRAQQEPGYKQLFTVDYFSVYRLTPDDVGDLRTTLIAADTKMAEMQSAYYAQYPTPTIEEEREQANRLSQAEGAKEWAVRSQADDEMRRNQCNEILNAIGELKSQLGQDDFIRLDNDVVREIFGRKGPVHRHRAVHKSTPRTPADSSSTPPDRR